MAYFKFAVFHGYAYGPCFEQKGVHKSHIVIEAVSREEATRKLIEGHHRNPFDSYRFVGEVDGDDTARNLESFDYQFGSVS